MEYGNANRRGFLKRLATAVAGLMLVPAIASPAQARWSRYRRGGWGGYGFYRGPNRRFYGGFPGYGYGGYGPVYRGYGGFAPGLYNRGYYGGRLPYGGGFYGPVAPPVPFYNYGVPILKREKPRDVFDTLTLLEC